MAIHPGVIADGFGAARQPPRTRAPYPVLAATLSRGGDEPRARTSGRLTSPGGQCPLPDTPDSASPSHRDRVADPARDVDDRGHAFTASPSPPRTSPIVPRDDRRGPTAGRARDPDRERRAGQLARDRVQRSRRWLRVATGQPAPAAVHQRRGSISARSIAPSQRPPDAPGAHGRREAGAAGDRPADVLVGALLPA